MLVEDFIVSLSKACNKDIFICNCLFWTKNSALLVVFEAMLLNILVSLLLVFVINKYYPRV